LRTTILENFPLKAILNNLFLSVNDLGVQKLNFWACMLEFCKNLKTKKKRFRFYPEPRIILSDVKSSDVKSDDLYKKLMGKFVLDILPTKAILGKVPMQNSKKKDSKPNISGQKKEPGILFPDSILLCVKEELCL